MMNFKKISIMEFRKKPGMFLDMIQNDDARFVIHRQDKPVACLVPVSELFITNKKENVEYEDFDPMTLLKEGDES